MRSKLTLAIDRDLGSNKRAYHAPGEPLVSYAGLLSLYGLAMGSFVAACRMNMIKPHRLAMQDLLVAGIATHKLTRIIALDEVTSPLRAPFARRRGPGEEPSEVDDTPRGKGLRKAFGTLLTCPWCLAPWIGGASVAGLMFAPKTTRVFLYVFTVAAVSDFLNTAYEKAWKG